MLKNLKERLKYLLFPWYEISKKICYLQRKSGFFYKVGCKHLANFYSYQIYRKYKCDISCEAIIGENVTFPHPLGIVIGKGVEVGDNTVIYQNVTLGRKNREVAEYPIVGKNVVIYCNTTIIGKIKIGDNSIIGCNSVVLKSIENNKKCAGIIK